MYLFLINWILKWVLYLYYNDILDGRKLSVHWREVGRNNLSMAIFRERIHLKEFSWGKLIGGRGIHNEGEFFWYHKIYTGISSLRRKICNIKGTYFQKIYTVNSSLGGRSMYQHRSTKYCSRWIAPVESSLSLLYREKYPKRIDINVRHNCFWKCMGAWRWEKSLLIEKTKNKMEGICLLYFLYWQYFVYKFKKSSYWSELLKKKLRFFCNILFSLFLLFFRNPF